MEVKPDNPAARLYLILNAMKARPNKEKLSSAWAQILGIDLNDADRYFELKYRMLRLVATSKARVKAQNVNQDLYLLPFTGIEKVFSLSDDHQIENMKSILDEKTMTGLLFCAEMLSRSESETVIETDVLEGLLSKVDQIINSISAEDLPLRLQDFLLVHLLKVKDSLLYYRVHGASGIEEALRDFAWVWETRGFRRAYEQDGNERKPVVRSVISLVEELLSIVANARSIINLINWPGFPLLGP